MAKQRTESRGWGLRRGVAHKKGLLLAAAVTALFAIVVTIFVLRSPQKGSAQPTTDPGPAPDIKELPNGAGSFGKVARTGRFFAQVVDKNDLSRLSSEITAERSEPLENQRVRLEKPEGWVFLKSGRTVYFRGDTGRAYIPDEAGGPGSRPHDGVLDGNVHILMFDPRPDGKRPTVGADEPILDLTTDSVSYDGELGQVKIPRRFVLLSDSADFTGSGLTVLFNEVQQHIELARVESREYCMVRPSRRNQKKATAPAAPPTPSPAAPNPPTNTPVSPTAKPKPPAPPIETLYHIVCNDQVEVIQGGRKINAELLEGWVRMEGNALRPGAIAMSGLNEDKTKQTTGGKNDPATTQSPGAPQSQASSQTAVATQDTARPEALVGPTQPNESDLPVSLAWSGPMEVRPVTTAPELQRNDVYVRFTSKEDGHVTFADEKSKATATGNDLEYGATSRDVAIAGKASATIDAPGRGHAEGRRFEMNLANGRAHAPGRGQLSATKDNPEAGPTRAERTFAWSDQADFQFKLSKKNDVTQALTEVHASGNTSASDGKSALSGDSLAAFFTPISDDKSRIERVQVVGSATGRDAKGGSLSSDTLDVTFVAAPGKEADGDPSVVTAQGNVRGERSGDILKADYLQAHLERREKEPEPTSILAKGNIDFENHEGAKAKAPQLEADPVAHTAHLFGPGTQVVKQGTTITGEDMTFSQDDRHLVVSTPGTLVHEGGLKKTDNTGDHTEVSWARGLDFRDLEGIAVCTGDAHAVTTKPEEGGSLTRDELNADTVVLTLSPGSADSKKADKDESRRLLAAVATGNDKPATVESRHMTAVAGAEPVTDRLMYLSAPTINADNENRHLDVNVPGKLFFMDRRAGNDMGPPKPGSSPLDTSGGAKGSSLFTWSGTMSMDRNTETVTMDRAVHMDHQGLDAGDVTRLECESLVAKLREVNKGEKKKDALDGAAQLETADAKGGVWMQSGTKDLVADIMHYDALIELINAKANDGNLVSVFDAKNGSTINAREIDWDRLHDRIDIKKVAPVTAPR